MPGAAPPSGTMSRWSQPLRTGTSVPHPPDLPCARANIAGVVADGVRGHRVALAVGRIIPDIAHLPKVPFLIVGVGWGGDRPHHLRPSPPASGGPRHPCGQLPPCEPALVGGADGLHGRPDGGHDRRALSTPDERASGPEHGQGLKPCTMSWTVWRSPLRERRPGADIGRPWRRKPIDSKKAMAPWFSPRVSR